jgi:hypothetical protein
MVEAALSSEITVIAHSHSARASPLTALEVENYLTAVFTLRARAPRRRCQSRNVFDFERRRAVKRGNLSRMAKRGCF